MTCRAVGRGPGDSLARRDFFPLGVRRHRRIAHGRREQCGCAPNYRGRWHRGELGKSPQLRSRVRGRERWQCGSLFAPRAGPDGERSAQFVTGARHRGATASASPYDFRRGRQRRILPRKIDRYPFLYLTVTLFQKRHRRGNRRVRRMALSRRP